MLRPYRSIISLKDYGKKGGNAQYRRGRIQHREPDLLRGIDDENRANGKGNSLLGQVIQVVLANHIVQKGYFSIRVGDDRKFDGGR